MSCQYLECCNTNNNNVINVKVETSKNPFDLFTQNIVFEKGYCESGYAGTIATDDIRVFAPNVVEKDYAVGYFSPKKRLKYFVTLGDKTLDEAIEIAKSKIDVNTIFVLIAPTYNTYVVGAKDFVIYKLSGKLVNNIFDEVNNNYLKYIFESVKLIVNKNMTAIIEEKLKELSPTIILDINDKQIDCGLRKDFEFCGAKFYIEIKDRK